MKYLSGQSNYDKFPNVEVKGFDHSAVRNWDSIVDTIKQRLQGQDKHILVIDTYHGVNHNEILDQLVAPLSPALVVSMDDAKYSEEHIFAMLERNITDDRVFGVIAPHKLDEFFDCEKLQQLKQAVTDSDSGLIVVLGHGARLVAEGDTFIYADLARWEIQQRFRRGELGNWGAENCDEDVLRRYKRSFFIEWRVFDRYKTKLLSDIDFLLDTNTAFDPKMLSGTAFNAGLQQATTQPFRLVPFFDPGVWGGQWMKEVCDLDQDKPNYAWCFDCVPEENSLLLKYGDVVVEIPSQDLVLTQPRALLGDAVHARFGAEFPIRFDFLDTMQGQHLSLQVHPLTEYIQNEFGMHYTQDESYYMLDTGEKASVYLGTKSGINPDEMMDDLYAAQRGEKSFDDERFINQFPAKKHDHFLIPAGTIHCSGSDSMVLEISATPYIFTFKLWDWDRLGLDGLPRPVHLDHGKEVIQWERNTEWCQEHLVNAITPIAEGEGWREEKTGLHEREFIETRRHWFSKPVLHKTEGTVNVLNLVEGKEAIILSPDNKFEPLVVHYAETFVIPAHIDAYVIQPYGESEGKEIATIKAFVRG
ncbi:class I mannose-6-phosphate isomerase [Vibrio vulnificus]|uniref:class I mannose-6-phosphate isomerase n=1 Tax=Vibrio vulnificus TaxID=672 RepID=UPI001CDD77F7|nr:class I mannose-6-phosphate isomerase [Vibrio vulnificus]EGQ8088561.1 mannose-6-phosphate isomerase [Vibrio vulnificus]EIV8495167.1 class I mannose-6-phosphate isomerase [Vibrio vulnificus]EIZ1051647.1 class I mannose-6-phosphate isomerase [Vibrio vulnificus]EJE8534080.1 class I mannose-6-phosphate isomerase [Vibrio vulnificus]EJE8734491.1 class I mannose-6-phosphate isomerase [Vibrio vulnificus]